jgi:hypothetical protein
VRQYLKRLVASRVARSNSNRIIMKTISPSEILFITKFVQNLISYKKYSDHFHVRVTEIRVSGRNIIFVIISNYTSQISFKHCTHLEITCAFLRHNACYNCQCRFAASTEDRLSLAASVPFLLLIMLKASSSRPNLLKVIERNR